MWAYLWSDDDVPDVRCTVDGSQIQNQPAPTSDNDEWLDWQMIYSGDLSKGNHTLNCDVTSASDDAPFFLKDFVIHPSDLPQLLIGDLSSASSTSEASTSTTGSPNSSNTYAVISSRHKASVGAIVGGVIGGIALVVLSVLVLELFLRRRRKGRYAQVGGYDEDGTVSAYQDASLVP